MNRQTRPPAHLVLHPFLILAFIFQFGCSSAADTGDASAVDAPLVAKQFVELVAQKDYSGAANKLDAVERMGLPPERLKSIWENLLAQYGELQNQTLVRTGTAAKGQTVTIKCVFERGSADVNLTVNNSGQVAGVAFTDS